MNCDPSDVESSMLSLSSSVLIISPALCQIHRFPFFWQMTRHCYNLLPNPPLSMNVPSDGFAILLAYTLWWIQYFGDAISFPLGHSSRRILTHCCSSLQLHHFLIQHYSLFQWYKGRQSAAARCFVFILVGLPGKMPDVAANLSRLQRIRDDFHYLLKIAENNLLKTNWLNAFAHCLL